MELYTAQLSKWRRCIVLDIPMIDTTVKSGDVSFAPTWDLLKRYRSGEINDDGYIKEFKVLMTESFNSKPHHWLNLCKRDKPVVIACYCPNGKFCHRKILVGYFEVLCKQYNIPFTYMGELI